MQDQDTTIKVLNALSTLKYLLQHIEAENILVKHEFHPLVVTRLKSDIAALEAISKTDVPEVVLALLEQLPATYPRANFTKEPTGYVLRINHTYIFQGATAEDAIKHTQNYVDARKQSPDLPVGVIYGIYD